LPKVLSRTAVPVSCGVVSFEHLTEDQADDVMIVAGVKGSLILRRNDIIGRCHHHAQVFHQFRIVP
jgi:hypothetical protein